FNPRIIAKNYGFWSRLPRMLVTVLTMIRMLRLEHVSKIYPLREALIDVHWEVKSGQRLGLVGANGSGKTTQFKIIVGETEPTTGQVFKPAGAKIACLSQEFDVQVENTVLDE